MSERVEKAIGIFRPENCSCSQAMAVTFGPTAGLDEVTARAAARGFGGGIAAHGLTCGAVTGAIMVLGVYAGRLEPDDTKAKHKAYELAHAFTKRFTDRHKTITCKELIGLDLSTEAGRKLNGEKKVTRTLCPAYVRTAAEILDEMLP